jgi:hypothetical protein
MNVFETRLRLDSMIVEIELTLVSIIQGVALYFLIESARGVILQMVFWPYIIAGLLVIFVFWSRSVLHIITVIRWPLEFGHNFLYIACALVEAVLFTRLARPLEWFTASAVFAAIGWVLFVYDLRLIQARIRDSAGAASDQLCILVQRDQWLNIALLLPAVFLLNMICAVVVQVRPEFFLNHNGHLWLISLQLFGSAAYLFYIVRYFARLAPVIVQARAEWETARERS